VDVDDSRVVDTLDKMERFQPIGHAILNRSGIIQVRILNNKNSAACLNKISISDTVF
jgi:hypothetical protein